MSTTKQQERDAFIGVLVENVPGAFTDLARYREVVQVADQFMKLARTLERINVRECNDDYADTDWGRNKRSRDIAASKRTEARLKDLCRHYGFGLNLGGDPRGYAVKLILPTGRYNTWGGKEEGYGVPT